MLLAHVTVEIPIGKIRAAQTWYRDRLGLIPIENNTDDGAVWFAEGVRLLPVKRWESHSMSHANFCLMVGHRYDTIQHLTLLDRQEDDNGERFFIQDPWTNRIEIRR